MIKIYFDSQLINSKYIMGLSQMATLFDKNFKLGSTLCREINLEVEKSGVSTQPTNVLIKDDQNVTLFTLQVDNIDAENDRYYSYTLVDKMVNLNQKYNWSSLSTPTVQNIVSAICVNLLGMTQANVPTVEYCGSLQVTWDEDTIARDFISYVAEINSSFARINNQGNLEFVKFNNTTSHTVNVNTCKDFKVGDENIIDRVVYEYGVGTIKIPDDTHYSGNGKTLYINPSNILFTDSGGFTRQAQVQHIYNLINGFSFRNVKTTRCYIDSSVKCGDNINFVNGTKIYKTIAQIDWTYNTTWIGGYELNLETQKQEETQINSSRDYVNSIKIKVDRELNQISQRVEGVETDVENIDERVTTITQSVSAIEQRAESIELSVQQITETTIPNVENRISSVEASLTLYVLKDEASQQVVSWINASADNIILNTKSLIFGEYPNGQYIEERNYTSNDECEYIETNNSTYVNSSFYTDSTGEIDFLFSVSEYPENGSTYVFGNDTTYMRLNSSKTLTFFCCGKATNYTIAENVKCHFVFNIATGQGSFNNDSFTFTSFSPYLSNYTLGFFARNNGSISGYSKIKFYEFKLLNNGDVTKDIYGKKDGQDIKLYESVNNVYLSGAMNVLYQLAKVGVLFDGTGNIRFEPEGEFRIENAKDSTIFNQMIVSHATSDNYSGINQIYYRNNNDYGAVSNLLRMANNFSYNSSYDKTNTTYIQNFSIDNSSDYANYISMISNSSNATSNKESNNLFIYNYKFTGNNPANYIRLISTNVTNTLACYNYLFGTNNRANSMTMSADSNGNDLSLYNHKIGGVASNFIILNATTNSGYIRMANNDIASESAVFANIINLNSESGGNNISISNYKSGNIANVLSLYSTSSDNYVSIQNYDGTTQSRMVNSFKISKTNGIAMGNSNSDFFMDMLGNVTLSGNNGLTLKSPHYNVYVNANNAYVSDAGYVYLEYRRGLRVRAYSSDYAYTQYNLYFNGGYVRYN